MQELWFLHSARRLMLVNICMKFHEDTLNSFKVTKRTQFCLRNCYLQSSKGHNSKSINTRVMVLAFCTSSNVGYICMKFHEDTLNGFQVTERTRFCDGQTDGQTTQEKTICLPTLKGGDIITMNIHEPREITIQTCKILCKFYQLSTPKIISCI